MQLYWCEYDSFTGINLTVGTALDLVGYVFLNRVGTSTIYMFYFFKFNFSSLIIRGHLSG